MAPPSPTPTADDQERRARVADLTRELFRQATALSAAITEASGLHHTDAAALRALDAAAGAPITVSRLGADLNLSSGAVTALVDRLERHGMVQRTRDAGDRRRVHVSLTPKARALGADSSRRSPTASGTPSGTSTPRTSAWSSAIWRPWSTPRGSRLTRGRRAPQQATSRRPIRQCGPAPTRPGGGAHGKRVVTRR
jgi:DNA-binding MarR family transcriptional regulator